MTSKTVFRMRCRAAVLQSSSAAESMHIFPGMVAVRFMLDQSRAVSTARLHRCIRTVLSLLCKAALLQRACTGSQGWLLCALCWVTVGLYDLQNLTGVVAVTIRAVFSLLCKAAELKRACTLSQGWLLCALCWVDVRLYQRQDFTSVFALTSKTVFTCLAEQQC